MMHELIAAPGLQLYVHRLLGTLRYTLTIAGRAPKHFELSDEEFANTSPQVKSESTRNLQGTEASAVGLELRLVKNDDVLDMEFEGRNGGMAEWRFVGLQEQGRIVGVAGTQTKGPSMVEGGVQTDGVAVVTVGVQTMKARVGDVGVQTPVTSRHIDQLESMYQSQKAQLAEQAEMIDKYVPKDGWKNPWPRHLFMTGFKNPHKGTCGIQGILHIDRKTGKVRWREVHQIDDHRLQRRSMKEMINISNTARKFRIGHSPK
jgi:hypothetical protein